MDNSIRLRVTDCVNSFIETFRENTDDFLYESEIHSILYSKLREKITERIELPIEIHTQLNEDRISTGIVRAEYPNALEYDIAIIHPLSQRRTTVGVDKNEAWWMQYLLGAIELKSWRLGDNIKKKLSSFSDDIEKKLRKYNHYGEDFKFEYEFGLALLFVQRLAGNVKNKIVKHFGREHLKEVNKIDLVSGIEGYIITNAEVYRVIQF